MVLEAIIAPAAQATVRTLLLGGIIIVVGAWCFSWRVAPAFAGDDAAVAGVRGRALRVLLLAVSLLAVALAWRLVQQAAAFADAPGEWTSQLSLVLSKTTWGIGWMLQGAALLLVAIAAPRAFRPRRPSGTALGIGTLALAITPALSGHAVGAPRLAPLAVAMDALHVVAAGAWLGTLFVLVVAALPAARLVSPGVGADLLVRFSPLALASAGVVAGSGLFAAWLHLGTVSALWTTDYGLALVRKLMVLAGVAALGAYNWRVVTPRVRATGSLEAMKRSALVELALALALVVLTAVLVATPLPGEL